MELIDDTPHEFCAGLLGQQNLERRLRTVAVQEVLHVSIRAQALAHIPTKAVKQQEIRVLAQEVLVCAVHNLTQMKSKNEFETNW